MNTAHTAVSKANQTSAPRGYEKARQWCRQREVRIWSRKDARGLQEVRNQAE